MPHFRWGQHIDIVKENQFALMFLTCSYNAFHERRPGFLPHLGIVLETNKYIYNFRSHNGLIHMLWVSKVGRHGLIGRVYFVGVAAHQPDLVRIRCKFFCQVSAYGTTGSAHAIAQSLGVDADLPHAAAVALVLPEVLEKTWPAIADVFASSAEAFGIKPARSVEQQCRQIVQWWRSRTCVKWAQQILAKVLWDDQKTLALAHNVAATMQQPLRRHPVLFTDQNIAEILNAVWSAKENNNTQKSHAK